MKTSKLFTIVICTYNSENRIGRALHHIIKQNKFSELVDKLIVVNNNSTDNTQRILNSFWPTVISIFEPRPGLSHARLAGAKRVETPWLIYIDDDNLIEQDWLIKAANFINANPQVGAFNGAVIPLIEDKLTKEEKERLSICYRRLACSHLNRHSIRPVSDHIPISAGLVVRTKPIKQLIDHGWVKRTGRVSENLFGGENIELALFIRSQGYEFGFCHTMLIKHIISKNRLSWQYLLNLYRNNDIELELRSARFGHLSSVYLLGESFITITKYMIRKIIPKVTRREILTLELQKEQAVSYLTGLISGKRLPNNVKPLCGHNNFIGHRSFN